MRCDAAGVGVWLSLLVYRWPSAPLAGATASIELSVAGRRNATPTIAADGQVRRGRLGRRPARAERPTSSSPSAVTAARTFGAPVRVNDVDGDARAERRATAARRAGARVPAASLPSSSSGRRRARTVRRCCSRDPTMADGRSRRPRSCPAPTRRGIAVGKRSRSSREAASTPSGSITASSRTIRRWPRRTTITRAPASRTASRWRRSRSCSSRRSTATLAPRAVTGGVCYCCKTALGRGRRRDLRRLASRLSRQPSRHGVHDVARRRPHFRRAGPGQRGPVGARRLSGRRTGDGGRRAEPDPHRVADAGHGARRRRGARRTSRCSTRCPPTAAQFTAREPIPTEGLPHHPRIVIGADRAR